MSEPKTKPSEVSLEDFIAQQPEARQEDCRTLDAMMRKLTGEDAVMWGNIVGYGRYAYKRSDGKTYEWPVAGFSPRKQALTIYVMPGFDRLEDLLAKLGKHTSSKSCLYIKRLSDVDLNVLEQIVKASVQAMEPVRIRGK